MFHVLSNALIPILIYEYSTYFNCEFNIMFFMFSPLVNQHHWPSVVSSMFFVAMFSLLDLNTITPQFTGKSVDIMKNSCRPRWRNEAGCQWPSAKSIALAVDH